MADTRAQEEHVDRGLELQQASTCVLRERIERGFALQRGESRSLQERMERRMDILVARQRSDFRWLPGVMLAGVTSMPGAYGGLPGVIAHGFHWL